MKNNKLVTLTAVALGVCGLVFSNLPLIEAASFGLLPNSSVEINNAFTGVTPVAPIFQSFLPNAMPTCNSTTVSTVANNGTLLTAGQGQLVMVSNATVAITQGVALGTTSTGSNTLWAGCTSNGSSGTIAWEVQF